MHKKFFAMILTAMLAFSGMALPVAAASDDAIIAGDNIMSVNTYTASSQLTVNGTSAVCTSTGRGAANTTTKITVLQVLEKQNAQGNWCSVASWYKIANTYQITVVNTASNLASGNYRLKTTFTFYSDSSSEPVVKYSITKTV